MAYGLKYYTEFNKIGGQLVRVEIHKRDYVGATETFELASDEPIIIEYPEKERTEPLLSSGCFLNILQPKESPFKFADLFITPQRDHIVKILIGGTIKWAGFILPDLFESELNKRNNVVRIPCNDGLSILEFENDFDFGPLSADYYVFIDTIIETILAKIDLGLTVEYNSVLRSAIHHNLNPAITEAFFKNTLVPVEFLYNDQEEQTYRNGKEILEMLLVGFQLAQVNGTWKLDRIMDLDNNNLVLAGTNFDYYEGGNLQVTAGLKEVVCNLDLIKFDNLIYQKSLDQATEETGAEPWTLSYKAWKKPAGVTISKDTTGYLVVTDPLNYTRFEGIGTRSRPFNYKANSKDTLTIKVDYEVPVSVIQAYKNQRNNIISEVKLFLNDTYWLYNDSGTFKSRSSSNIFTKVWESFDLDFEDALVRLDDRRITHSITINLADLDTELSTTYNRLDVYICPLLIGDDLDNVDFDDAVNFNHWIRDINISYNPEGEPANQFTASLDQDFTESDSLTFHVGDSVNTNYANTLYAYTSELDQIPDRTVSGWTDDNINFYNYVSKQVADLFNIFAKGRYEIRSEVLANQIIYINDLIQENNITASPIKFKITGMKWNVKFNRYDLVLSEWSNDASLTVNVTQE